MLEQDACVLDNRLPSKEELGKNMENEIKEFVGEKRPITHIIILSICMPLFFLILERWKEMDLGQLAVVLIVAVLLVFVMVKISPKFEPRKRIRFGERSLAMYQDDAIHWHIPYSDIHSFSIALSESVYLNRGNRLTVFNSIGEQLIDQDVSFLSANQRDELLEMLSRRHGDH
ncbi:hypothetical protein [Pseudoteredinibacter isoporae]|uniref:hypothetical protein n=1 Tax=Pseudoteredinibacter isoporae TaxID=570281 RepID=UPI0031043253